jgi:hypothetical protein
MIDLEIFILICLILVLIYNYHTNDCYKYFKKNKRKNNTYIKPIVYQYDTSCFSNRLPIKSNVNYPKIELEGFANSDKPTTTIESNKDSTIVNNDPQKLPDNVMLNDRYNDFITPYTDKQLADMLSKSTLDNSGDYSQSLVDDLQKNIIFDIDTKVNNKSKQTQKLSKDSATIASRFGRNSLLESYKNELDEYERERTPWWAETD